MKYSVNQRRISSFVKIVNFVRQARAKDQICLMAVYMKELKINTPLGCAFSTHILSKLLILWANSFAKSRSAPWQFVKLLFNNLYFESIFKAKANSVPKFIVSIHSSGSRYVFRGSGCTGQAIFWTGLKKSGICITATVGSHSDFAPPTKLTILTKLEILPAFAEYFI